MKMYIRSISLSSRPDCLHGDGGSSVETLSQHSTQQLRDTRLIRSLQLYNMCLQLSYLPGVASSIAVIGVATWGRPGEVK